MNITIFQNSIIQLNTSDIIFMSFSTSVQMNNVTFLNNTFNVPFLANKFPLDFLIMSSISFLENVYDDSSNTVNLIIFQNGGVAMLSGITLIDNYVNQNLISISFWDNVNASEISLIDNISKELLLFEYCNILILQIFSCINYNQIDMTNPETYSFVGSCLQIFTIPSIFINSTMVCNSTGLLNIPGFVILNNFIQSNITISYSIFVNNTFNSSQNVLSVGCALYILSYPYLSISNSYFKQNFALSIEIDFGGPVLCFSSEKTSTLIMENVIFENNYSIKRALILEFQGYNATMNNCQFLMNMQYTYTPITFETQIIINGLASYFGLNNCLIYGNTARDGIYFLQPQNQLVMSFDYVKILNNNGYYSAAFVSQFETTNLIITLSNSQIDHNYVAHGGVYVYFYICDPIVQFNFTTTNSSISNNNCDIKSYGLMVVWIYTNNVTVILKDSTIIGNIYPCLTITKAFIRYYGIKEKIYIYTESCVFGNNTTGSIYLYYYQVLAVLKNITVIGTNHVGTNPIFFLRQATIDIYNVTFIENFAVNGFFHFIGACEVFMNQTIFMTNDIGSYFLSATDTLSLIIQDSTIQLTHIYSYVVHFWYLQNVQNCTMQNLTFIDNYGIFNIMFYEIDTIMNLSSLSVIVTELDD